MKKHASVFSAMVAGVILGIAITEKKNKKCMMKELLTSNKNYTLFRIMSQWLKVKQKGKNLSEYFELAGYKKIAIYGMGYLGETLLKELSDTKTEVLYGIDQNAASIYAKVDVLSLKDELQSVDVVVVTVINSFEMISENIKKELDCPVISIVDVVHDIS